MAYTDEYFEGIKEGERIIITLVNFTITDFKKGATEKEIDWLNELQEEMDACEDICLGDEK